NLENLNIPQKVSKAIDEIVTDAVDWALQAPLHARFRDLPNVDMKEILLQRIWEIGSYKTHEDHKNLYEALEKSMDHDHSDQLLADLAKARVSGAPAVGLQVHLSDDEDNGSDHLPKADMRKDWWKPLPEEEIPATPEPTWTIPSSNVSDTGDIMTFMNWYCQKVNKTVLTQADFKRQAYEVVKAFYPNVIQLQFQMEECHKMLTDQINWANPEGDQVRIDVNRPLPVGGPLGHVTIQTQFFFNKDLEYLRYGNKESRPALSISKMNVAPYPDVGLKLLVPEQIWIDE
ncbi:hypothetical protein Tco_0027678, partial [Tanacetum coccineum]